MSETTPPQSFSAVTRDIIMDVPVTPAKLTDRIQTRRIRMPAGTPAGLHTHNGPVVGSIVSGSVAFRIDGEPQVILRPGDVFFEPEAERIAQFDALDEDVVFLGHFLLSSDQEPTLEFLES
ncbi:cupin domain-containing protein [Nocardia sp. CDC153]|uniref:cupin domain-containing protein n=1 Tax=Nocardia sp. CDC153 TaxID=3112167 RepID=UPI002DB9AE7C|nr:cupin domain-containing protein [Nocardia sp. CDC153]MEC3956044.1 cupin domain-containing protein [Nocardia sp. CDC153]